MIKAISEAFFIPKIAEFIVIAKARVTTVKNQSLKMNSILSFIKINIKATAKNSAIIIEIREIGGVISAGGAVPYGRYETVIFLIFPESSDISFISGVYAYIKEISDDSGN